MRYEMNTALGRGTTQAVYCPYFPPSFLPQPPCSHTNILSIVDVVDGQCRAIARAGAGNRRLKDHNVFHAGKESLLVAGTTPK